MEPTQIQTNMECTPVQLGDLPDEILLIIFQKLSYTPLLYSLIGVNKRLNQLVHDSIFTNRLTLVRSILHHSTISPLFSRDFVYPFIDPVLDRFCLSILPEIHQQIQWLCLEPLSMGRILRAIEYPNLHELALFNIEPSKALDLFSGKVFYFDSCKVNNPLKPYLIN